MMEKRNIDTNGLRVAGVTKDAITLRKEDGVIIRVLWSDLKGGRG